MSPIFFPTIVQIAEAYGRLRSDDLSKIRRGERIRIPIQMPMLEGYMVSREAGDMPVSWEVSSVEFEGRFERSTPDGKWFVVRETYGNNMVDRKFVSDRGKEI